MRKCRWMAGAALVLALGMGLQAGAGEIAESWANEVGGILNLLMGDTQSGQRQEETAEAADPWAESEDPWAEEDTVPPEEAVTDPTVPGGLIGVTPEEPVSEAADTVNDDVVLDDTQSTTVSAEEYRNLLTAYLDREEIIYTVAESGSVKITYTCDNTDVTVFVQFDDNWEDNIRLVSYTFGHFGEEKLQAGISLCNDLNKEYRWIKFYIDDDYDLTCDADAYVDKDTIGDVCMKMVRRMINIMDEVYPQVMQARWGA